MHTQTHRRMTCHADRKVYSRHSLSTKFLSVYYSRQKSGEVEITLHIGFETYMYQSQQIHDERISRHASMLAL